MSEQLAVLGILDDDEIELDLAALELAALDHPQADLAPYFELIEAIGERLEARAAASTPQARAAALAQVIGGEFGFEGDRETYDDPANADLMCVLDRRRGLPVALAILYVTAGRRLGWKVDALNTPAHVLVSVGRPGELVIDPFDAGRPVRPQAVSALLRSAGLADKPAAILSNREVLTRLLMNQATRAEQAGERSRALTLFTRITAFAPGHSLAWWDRARLEQAAGDAAAARRSLVSLLETTRDPALRHRAQRTLHIRGG